jgi:serine protease Do
MAIESIVAVGPALAEELDELARRVRTGVVQVGNGRGGGAGTIWSSDGLIVTNHHVVPGDGARVTLADRRTLQASVIAALPERDLAVLQVAATDLPALTAGDSTALRPGEVVMAVGHPLGVRDAVSLGIFSGVGPIEGRGNNRHMQEALLANIDLRPGNSGGPLVNVRGEVVGINAMVIGRRTALAVPSATVTRLIEGRTRRTLGVQVQPIETPSPLATRYGIAQAGVLLVIGVSPDTAAARAELLPGDIILAIDAFTLQEPGDLAWALTGDAVGQTATLRLLRGGVPREVTVRF